MSDYWRGYLIGVGSVSLGVLTSHLWRVCS